VPGESGGTPLDRSLPSLSDRGIAAQHTGTLFLTAAEWDAVKATMPRDESSFAYRVNMVGVIGNFRGVQVVVEEDPDRHVYAGHSKVLCYGQVHGCSCQSPTAAEMRGASEALAGVERRLLEARALEEVGQEHPEEGEAGVLHGSLDHAAPGGHKLQEAAGRAGPVGPPLSPDPPDVVVGDGARGDGGHGAA
jgi:hypothetical protein